MAPNRGAACIVLSVLGCLQAVTYGVITKFSFSFSFGAIDRPIRTVVGLFLASTLCYFLALLCVFRWKALAESWRIVLLFALLFRMTLVASQPILEIDFYRYLWDGRVTLSGLNPYHHSPFEIEDAVDEPQPSAELAELVSLSRQSPTVQTIFSRVHWRAVPTVYPPAAQAVFALAARFTPADAPLETHILVLKSLLILFDLGTVGVLIVLLKHLGLPPAWALVYAWCPLVLKEFANSGHLDAVAIFFTTLALYLLLRWSSLLGAGIGMGVLGVAVLSKSYPLVLLPVVSAWLLGRFGWKAILPLLATPLIITAGYAPFIGGTSSHHAGSGLSTFLTEWETNDYLFMLVYDNVRPSEPEAAPWHIVVPEAWRESLDRDVWQPARDIFNLPLKANAAFIATQAFMGTILLLLCLGWAWRAYRNPEAESLLRGSFRSLAWGWLLSSAQNPWYLLCCLPLMVFDSRCSWFLLFGLVWLYYVRFWFDDQPWDARPLRDGDLVWLEFAPFFLALTIESWLPCLSGGAKSCVPESC